MTPNWPEDFELESRRTLAGTDAKQTEYEAMANLTPPYLDGKLPLIKLTPEQVDDLVIRDLDGVTQDEAKQVFDLCKQSDKKEGG